MKLIKLQQETAIRGLNPYSERIFSFKYTDRFVKIFLYNNTEGLVILTIKILFISINIDITSIILGIKKGLLTHKIKDV